MSLAKRLFTGAYSALFTAAAIGAGYEAEQCIATTFKAAASQYAAAGDVVLGTALSIGVSGLALLAAAGAVWMGKQTIHPD